MYDGSVLSFEENLANTQMVVSFAKQTGASVEAEIGCMGKRETGSQYPGCHARRFRRQRRGFQKSHSQRCAQGELLYIPVERDGKKYKYCYSLVESDKETPIMYHEIVRWGTKSMKENCKKAMKVFFMQ